MAGLICMCSWALGWWREMEQRGRVEMDDGADMRRASGQPAFLRLTLSPWQQAGLSLVMSVLSAPCLWDTSSPPCRGFFRATPSTNMIYTRLSPPLSILHPAFSSICSDPPLTTSHQPFLTPLLRSFILSPTFVHVLSFLWVRTPAESMELVWVSLSPSWVESLLLCFWTLPWMDLLYPLKLAAAFMGEVPVKAMETIYLEEHGETTSRI